MGLVAVLLLALVGVAHAALIVAGPGGHGAVTEQLELISDARVTDWSYAGTDIPTTRTQCGSTVSAYTGTSGTIESALSACGANQYVLLGCGTFNLSTALDVAQKNDITLRGTVSGGSLCSILNFTGISGSSWFWQGGSAAVSITASFAGYSDSAPPIEGNRSGQVRDWDGTDGNANVYAQGATVMNLASTPTGLGIGDVVFMWEDNEPDANLPQSGFFTSSKSTGSGALGISWEGSYDDMGASLIQRSVVLAVSGANVTIDPPLAHGAFTAARNPKVSWADSSDYVSGVGLEYLRIDTDGIGEHNTVLGIGHAMNSWVKGVAFLPEFTSWHATGATDYTVALNDSLLIEIRDSWFHTSRGGGINTTTSYGVSTKGSTFLKIENNIFNNVESPLVPNIATMGSVFAYNFENYVGDDQQEAGIQPHEPGTIFNLFEGNSAHHFWGDLFHGNTALNTIYRSHFFSRGIDLSSYHRFYNVIGNVIDAATTRKSLVSDVSKVTRFADFGFRLGYPSEGASSANTTGVAADLELAGTTLLWDNYVTSGGRQSNESEVPVSDPDFPNPVPTVETLPDSLVYDAAPSFFTVNGVAVTFPPIGPEVTGGDFMGGRAHKLPAEVAFDNAGEDVASFDPTEYGQ